MAHLHGVIRVGSGRDGLVLESAPGGVREYNDLLLLDSPRVLHRTQDSLRLTRSARMDRQGWRKGNER